MIWISKSINIILLIIVQIGFIESTGTHLLEDIIFYDNCFYLVSRIYFFVISYFDSKMFS